jgi:hypothetical protein
MNKQREDIKSLVVSLGEMLAEHQAIFEREGKFESEEFTEDFERAEKLYNKYK